MILNKKSADPDYFFIKKLCVKKSYGIIIVKQEFYKQTNKII
jgi:hypothetical protein